MIEYRDDVTPATAEVQRLFDASGINRPTDNPQRIETMIKNANLLFSAWDGSRLVGLCRALSDFSYCCYLSDLAVDAAYQKQGIGRELIRRTQQRIGDEVSLILLAAPDAMPYYPQLGFSLADNAYVIRRKR